jgi:hypothetical protein
MIYTESIIENNIILVNIKKLTEKITFKNGIGNRNNISEKNTW